MMMLHPARSSSTTFSRVGPICSREEMVLGHTDLLQSPAPGVLMLGNDGLDWLLQRHAAHDMFDEMSTAEVLWDEEVPSEINMNNDLLQQLVQEMDDQGQCKQVIFKAPVLYKGAVHEVLDEMYLEKETSAHQNQVVFMDPMALQDPIHEVLHEIPIGTVVWADDSHHNHNSHGNLLHELYGHNELVQQEALFDECLHVDTKATVDLLTNTTDKLSIDLPHEVVWDEEMSSNIIMHSGLLQHLAFGSNNTYDTTTQPTESDINTHGVLVQLALGEEMLHNASSAGLLQKLASGSNDLDMPSALLQQLVSALLQQLVWDDELLHSLDSQDDLLQHLAPDVERKVSTGPALDDLLTPVHDQFPMLATSVDSMHGVLAEMHPENDTIVLAKQVQSMDPVPSLRASHVMFLAMPCMDVVWDDNLLGGHGYLEQAESKTATMRRIRANVDKQKIDGTSNYKRMQVSLDNSEVFAELHNRLAWDSNMKSDIQLKTQPYRQT